MATMKFKIGDMVQRINHNNGNKDCYFKVGQVGKVVKIRDDNFVDVKVDGKVNTWNAVKNLELVDTETFKFKIGDRVKVVNPAYHFKERFRGTEFTIESYNPNGKKTFHEPHYGVGGTYVWQESELELVTNSKIVITHDGKTTTATMYKEDGSKEVATARCAPEDKFDFPVGAKLAMERLMAKVTGSEPKEEPPKYWTGRVVCIQTDNDAHAKSFDVGRIYKVDNGKFTDNLNRVRPVSSDRVSSPEDLTAESGYFSDWAYKFIPIVEDEEKPLTIEELNKMDGQKVYVIRLDENGVETPNHRFCGWHTVNVKQNQLIDIEGDHYCINSMNHSYGFHAYRTAPRK